MSIRIEIDGLAQLQQRLAAMGSGLDAKVDEALLDSARLVSTSAKKRAPRRSGRLRASITPFVDGSAAGVHVTARRTSLSYPGGYPYPARIERRHPFLAPTVVQESKRIEDRMTRVLAEIGTQWGGG